MFEGGTNFGFMNGANSVASKLFPVPTSYDYDAPLTEAGNYTTKFIEIQKVIGKYAKIPPGPLPKATTAVAYGKVKIEKVFYINNLKIKFMKLLRRAIKASAIPSRNLGISSFMGRD